MMIHESVSTSQSDIFGYMIQHDTYHLVHVLAHGLLPPCVMLPPAPLSWPTWQLLLDLSQCPHARFAFLLWLLSNIEPLIASFADSRNLSPN